MGACNLQILPRLSLEADSKTENWCHSLLLLEKLFNQTAYEMPFYNTMQRLLYDDDVVQRAMSLIKNTGRTSQIIQTLYDRWRSNKETISFSSWALEASGHDERAQFMELLKHFSNLETGQPDLTTTRNVFENLKHFSDSDGKVWFLKDFQPVQVMASQFTQRATLRGQDQHETVWTCNKCWFKNGIQKVNGLWRRLCDSHKCGLCGALHHGTVTARNTGPTLSTIEKKQEQEHNDLTPIKSSISTTQNTDDIIQKCAQNNLHYLSCSVSKADTLCRDLEGLAEMLLKHDQYCKLMDHGKDAQLVAKELDKYCDINSYKSAVLRNVAEFVPSKAKETLLQTLKQQLDQNTDKICDFGVYFGFKGKSGKFKRFLKKYGKVKPGHATTITRKVRTELQKISLENWMKETADSARNLRQHVVREHLHGATESKKEAIYHFFQSVVHATDDVALRNECLDHRKQFRVEDARQHSGRSFDDIHCDLCHHQTVEEIWNGLINPLKCSTVNDIKQLLVDQCFPKMNVDDDFAVEVQSLILDAVEECHIDGKRFLSLSSHFVESKVMDIFESAHKKVVEDLQSLFVFSDDEVQQLSAEQMIVKMGTIRDCDLKMFVISYFSDHRVDGEKFVDDNLHNFEFVRPHIAARRKEMAGIWKAVRNILETFNFQTLCPIEKRADIEENYYGHPQVHSVFKKYFMTQGELCPDHNSLVHFAKEQIPKFKKGVPGDLQKAMASYFSARDDDEERAEIEAFLSRKVIAENIRDCSYQDLITLFTFQADDSDNDDEEKAFHSRSDDGVFARFEREGGSNVHKMREIDDWKQRIIEWIGREKISGEKLSGIAIRNALVSSDVFDDKGNRVYKQWNEPCRVLMRICNGSAVSDILKAAEAQKEPACLVMKRIKFILKRFHAKTREVGDQGLYEDGMRHFVGNLPEYGLENLQNDIEHILNHKWKGRPCPEGRECIHSQRALRDRQKPQSQNIELKKKFFRTKSPADFVAISMLDRLHCIVHHDGDMIRGNKTNESELFRAFKKDAHSTNIRQTCPVYDSGNFVDYSSLKPLHQNLREEMLNNRLCSIPEHEFDEHLKLSKLALTSNSTSAIKNRRAWKGDPANDIQMNDGPRIEHVLCIKMYCNNTALCKEFCHSFRSIKGKQDGKSEITEQDVIQNHIDNFYWFGRYLACAIELFGDEATSKKYFYRGVTTPFSFNEFSAVYEIPLSTTYSLTAAHQFAEESGIILCLSPKYKNEINSSRYLDVGALGLSDFDQEKERLVTYFPFHLFLIFQTHFLDITFILFSLLGCQCSP